jgi:hypothetical protein
LEDVGPLRPDTSALEHLNVNIEVNESLILLEPAAVGGFSGGGDTRDEQDHWGFFFGI